MDFDPNRPASTPRDAASVILLRRRADGEAEVFLLRRHRGASFMAQAFVFPGGARDGAEDLRVTAARELLEEAGVLLSEAPVAPERLAAMRRELDAKPLDAVLAANAVRLDLERLVPFAHWITPSAEKKRFSARFFVAVLPEGQTPSFDNKETIEELWATPHEALARAHELFLPPPQLRILLDIEDAARRGPDSVLELARSRGPHMKPIVPRLALIEGAPSGFALLLPWDPEYDSLGKGEGECFGPDHPLSCGPTRFFMEGLAWRHTGPVQKPSGDSAR